MFLASTIMVGIAIFVFVIVGVLCARAILANYYNPIPKFQNGDKRSSEIEVEKTRSIR